MKLTSLFLLFSSLALSGNAQQVFTTNGAKENNAESLPIHPEAKNLLKHDFYWNNEDPNSPFISTRVSNSYKLFGLWRLQHSQENPVNFLPKYETNQMSLYRNETDPNKIREFYTNLYNTQKKLIDQNRDMFINEIAKNTQEQQEEIIENAVREVSYKLLSEEDNLIISVGFGQFALEGKIDNDLKILTQNALIRQLNPFVLSIYPASENLEIRQSDLLVMLQDLRDMK